MSLLDIILLFIGVVFSHFMIQLCYKSIKNEDHPKPSRFKIVTIILIIALISTINSTLNHNITLLVIHFGLLCIMNYLIFKEKIDKTILKSAVIYSVACIIEIIISVIIGIFDIKDISAIMTNGSMRLIMAIVVLGSTYLIFKIKTINTLLNKMFKYIFDKNYFISKIIIILSLLLTGTMIFKSFVKVLSVSEYVINIFILLLFVAVIIVLILQIRKQINFETKEESLLDFIKECEYVIDKDRVNRHEMLNNLLTLKSYKNKSSKNYEMLLDDYIVEYQNTSTKSIGNVYNLPSGLKGILFYKISYMKTTDLKVNVNISNKAVSLFDDVPPKVFSKVCNISAILLDNAAEAALESKDKEVSVDIYKANEYINILIENTTKKKVDLDKINDHGYSTKGEGRGLGLAVVSKKIRKSKDLEMKQSYKSKRFSTMLKIKIHEED